VAEKSLQLSAQAPELASILADLADAVRVIADHTEFDIEAMREVPKYPEIVEALARLDVLVAALTEEERAEERREHEGLAWRDRAAEDEQAYDLRDPKHPRHYEVMADLWDFREGK
jgi:hypothetical protein